MLNLNIIPNFASILVLVFLSETGQGSYARSSQSFVFSMVNPQGKAPIKISPATNQQQNAIYCKSDYGPTFGGGHDFHISNNANTSGSSYNNLGFSYQLPTGQQNTFFTGARNFHVTDYEVFGIC